MDAPRCGHNGDGLPRSGSACSVLASERPSRLFEPSLQTPSHGFDQRRLFAQQVGVFARIGFDVEQLDRLTAPAEHLPASPANRLGGVGDRFRFVTL